MINEPTTLKEARRETYGPPWDKRAYREGLCVRRVWSGGRGSTSSQCSRKNGFGPGGLYCKQHDPTSVAKKQADRLAKYDAESNARTAQWAHRDECLRALAGIAEPERALAEAREALKEAKGYILSYGEETNMGPTIERIDKALAALTPGPATPQ